MTVNETMTTTEAEETEGRVGGLPRIRCSCGFEVMGADELNNANALATHQCPNRHVEHTPWWGYVFSEWGLAIVIVIVAGIVGVLHAMK